MEECLVPAHRNQHFQWLGTTTGMPKMRKVQLRRLLMAFMVRTWAGRRISIKYHRPRRPALARVADPDGVRPASQARPFKHRRFPNVRVRWGSFLRGMATLGRLPSVQAATAG